MANMHTHTQHWQELCNEQNTEITMMTLTTAIAAVMETAAAKKEKETIIITTTTTNTISGMERGILES